MKLIALFLSGVPLLTYAQHSEKTDAATPPKWRYDIGLSSGIDLLNTLQFSESGWLKFSEEGYDPSLKSTSNNRINTSSNYAHVNVGVSLKPLSETRKIDQLLRFGFGYAGQVSQTANWERNERYVIDTLTSSSNGKEYYRDSIVTYALTKRFEAKRYQFFAQYLIQTNREKRFSYYTGVGLGIDLLTQVKLMSGYNKYSKTESADFLNDDRPFDLNSQNYADFTFTPIENFKREYGTTVNANIQVPVGVDFRVGKKDNFMGRTVVGAEFLYKYGFFKMPKMDAIAVNEVRVGLHVRVRI